MTTVAVILLLSAITVALWLLLTRPLPPTESALKQDDERVTPLLRGINFLLSDQPDLALQEMVQVAKLRSEAADVYMALGEMFLAQGEIGRAVRIHQNILARPDVPQALYIQAHFALAKDFQTGGLLDRALRHYQKVLDVQSDHLNALIAALRIREQSHEWLEAEALLSRIERIRDDENQLHRAYLWAEMAQDALDANSSTRAQQHAQTALELSDVCLHAHLVLIHLELKKADMGRVQQRLTLMQQTAPDYLHLLVPLFLEYQPQLLHSFWQEKQSHELALSWMEQLAQKEPHAAMELQKTVQLIPRNLRESLRLAALGLNDDATLVQYARIWRKSMSHYHCTHCGVQTIEMRWQCPQCHTWGSMATIQEHQQMKELE